MASTSKTLEPWQIEDAQRLNALFKDRSPMSQMAFGAAFDIGNQSMVSQYLLGRRPLNIDAARKFAAGLQCSISDFSPTLAAKITEASVYSGSGSELASLPTSRGTKAAEQTQGRWPFSTPYEVYEALDEEKKKRLDERVADFLAGAAPPKSKAKAHKAKAA